MFKIISYNKLIFVFLFIGVLLSISYSNFLEKNYSKINSYVKFNNYHTFPFENSDHLKGEYIYPLSINGKDVHGYIMYADFILENINNGKSIFESQPKYTLSFLQPNVIAIYAYFTQQKIFKKKDDIKIFILDKYNLILFQIFFFYFAILFLYLSIKNILSKRESFLICAILCVEPTIMQWHISLMTDSIFVSLFIIMFGLVIKKELKFSFLCGIICGLAFLQRTIMLYYPLVIMIFFFVTRKNLTFFLVHSILFLSSFIIILSTLAVINYNRSGIHYIKPVQAVIHFELYYSHKLAPKKLGISKDEYLKNKNTMYEKIALNNNLNLKEEKDLVIFFRILEKESYKIVLDNFSEFSKIVIKHIPNAAVLDPTQLITRYTKYYSTESFMKSSEYNNILIFRIVYSIFFYFFSFVGIIYLLKEKKYELLLISICSITYFFFIALLPLGNNSRYFVPAIIFLSLFFAKGIEFSLKKLYKQ